MKRLLTLLIFVLAALFLAHKITEVPPGINGDEAALGYNAILISRNLHDESGKLMPLFIKPTGSDWKQPVTVYATALVFKIFGPSYFALRATSILFVVLSLTCLYHFAKILGNMRLFVVTAFLLITMPIIMIQSHLAIENIAVLPFIFFWILMLFKYEKNKKNKYLLWAGISLGIGMFSYYGMRIVVPALSVVSFVYIWTQFRKDFRKSVRAYLYFLIGVVPFFIILYLSKFVYPGAVVGNFRLTSMPSVYEFIYRYLSSYDLSFLFFKGDSTPYHSTGLYGMFLVMTLPLFLVGVRRIIIEKKPSFILILVSFFAAPILYGFVPEIYRASRLLIFVPFYTIIAGVGFESILRMKSYAVRGMTTVLFVVLIILNYTMFVTDYWYEYPKRAVQNFSTPLHTAFAIVRDNLLKNNYNFCIEGGIYKTETSQVNFFWEVYTPQKSLQFCEPFSAQPEGTIAMVNPNAITEEEKKSVREVSKLIGFYKVYIKD